MGEKLVSSTVRYALVLFAGLLLLASCTEASHLSSATFIASPGYTAWPTPSLAGVMPTDLSVVPTPSWTPMPTATPFPDVPLISHPAGYRLRPPDPEKLIAVLEMSSAYLPYWQLPDAERALVARQGKALARFIRFDIQHHYPDGVPDAGKITISSSLLASAYLQQDILWQILRAGVVQYLNAHAIQLAHGETQDLADWHVAAYRMTPADDVERWLVQVTFAQYAPHMTVFGFIPLEHDSSGRYRLVPNSLEMVALPPLYAPWQMAVRVDRDLVGARDNDIVIYQYGHSGGSTNYWMVDIYTWDQSGVHLAESIRRYEDRMRGLGKPVYAISDYTGDDRDDLRVTARVEGYFGCQYDAVDIYSWLDNRPRHTLARLPDTVACNMWRGFTERDQAQTILYLERTLEQWTLGTGSSVDLLVLVCTRLAMAYASQGQDVEALRVLGNIYRLPADFRLVRLVQDHMRRSADGNLVALFYSLCLDRKQVESAGIGRHIYDPLPSFGMGVAGWICPPRELVTGRLQAMRFPTVDPPADALAAADLVFEFGRAVNVDADGDVEWIGIVEPDRDPHLVILDAVDGQWQPIRVINYGYQKPIVDFQFRLLDVTGDGEPEIITLTASPDGCCEGCSQFKLSVKTLTEREFEETLYAEWLCTPVDLETLSAGYFDIVAPAWYTLLAFDGTDRDLPHYLGDLETHVISQTQPIKTSGEITALMAYLPEGEIAMRPAMCELKYLLGLNYELMGEEDQAIDAYLDLIQYEPNSPWSWLAWARLETLD